MHLRTAGKVFSVCLQVTATADDEVSPVQPGWSSSRGQLAKETSGLLLPVFTAVHCQDRGLHSICMKGAVQPTPRCHVDGPHWQPCPGSQGGPSWWGRREGYFLKEALSQRTLDPSFNVITWTPFKSGPHSRGRTADAQKTHEVNTVMFLWCLPRPWPGHSWSGPGGDPEQGRSCRERGLLPRGFEAHCAESQWRPHEKGCGCWSVRTFGARMVPCAFECPPPC